MFTGLIEGTGEVLWVLQREMGTQLVIKAKGVAHKLAIGDSLAINGCCLTVTQLRGEQIGFDVLQETLQCTNIGSIKPGDFANLERSIRAGKPMGGHFVQGHVDCAVKVVSITPHQADHRFEVVLPAEFSHLVAYKGSIAINGVSLTVAEVLERSVVCWVIPHTFKATNIGSLAMGDPVNIEFDILAKYVDRMISQKAERV